MHKDNGEVLGVFEGDLGVRGMCEASRGLRST